MTIDWTVSIGNMLTAVGFLGGGMLFVFTMRGDIRLFAQRINFMEKQMDAVERQLASMAELLNQIAVEKVRLDNMSIRITELYQNYEELRRGRGHIADGR